MYRSLSPGAVNIQLPFNELLPLARQHGFGAVEYSPLQLETETGIDGAIDLMGQNGVIISSFGLPVVVQQGDKEFDDSFPKLEKAARLARSLGIRRCGTYIFSWSDTLTFSENFILHVKRLRQCAQVLKEYGISFALEFLGPQELYRNSPNPFIHSLDGMLELCDAIGTGNMGILLDAHHCYTSGLDGDKFLRYIRSMEDILLVHINDDPKGAPIESLPDSPRCLPGEGGGIDLKGFMKGLQGLGYNGPVVVEPFSPTLAPLTDPNEIAGLVARSIDTCWPQ